MKEGSATTILEEKFLLWGQSIAAAWRGFPHPLRPMLVLWGIILLVLWAVWSPGTLLAACLATVLPVVLVRRERLRGREARIFLGILIAALALRYGAGALHYQYARWAGLGVDFFGDSRAYSSTGHYIAESFWSEEWPNVDNNDHNWLLDLRKKYEGRLPSYNWYRVKLFGFFVGTIYSLFGVSPVTVKWLAGLAGVLLAWLLYIFLRREGWDHSAPMALVLVAFYPSIFLWSASGLKDIWVLLSCMVLLGAYIRGDSTRRDSLTVAAMGRFALGPWVVVVSGVLLAAWLIMLVVRWRIGVRQMAVSTPYTESEQWGLGLSFWAIFLGASGITALYELRVIPAIVLSLVFIFPVLVRLLIKFKDLVSSLPSGNLRLSRPTRILALSFLLIVIGWVGQKKVNYLAERIAFTQKQLTVGARTPIYIYPDRYYDTEGTSIVRGLKSGNFKPLTPLELLAATPKGLFYSLLAPLPSLRGEWMHKAASAQMILFYGLYLLAAVGGVVSYRRVGWRYWPAWAFLGFGVLANALTQGNIGTLFRHREIMTPIILAVAAVGVVEVVRWFHGFEKKLIVARALAGSSRNVLKGKSDTDAKASYEPLLGSPEIMPSVLYVSYNSFFEPVFQSQALAYLRRLARRGMKFYLITFDKSELTPPLEQVAKSDEELETLGIKWFPRRYHKGPRFFSTFYDQMIGTMACAWHLATKPIDWIHARGVTPAAMALLPARLFRCPLIFDMRSSLAEAYADAGIWKAGGFWYRLVRHVETLAIRKAQWVVVETEAHRHLLDQSLGDPALAEKVKVIPCCVDLDRFVDVSEPGKDEPWELVYLGSLSGWYKFKEMLAFYKVARESWGVGRLVFLTDGSAEEIRRWLTEEGLPKNEVVVESLPFADVPRRLARARVGIVFTSPGRRLESLPVKVGEYLAAGLPLVVNAGMGDTEQLVRSHGVGVVVETFTEEGYRRAAAELNALRSHDGSLTRRCRDVARTRLSLESGVDKYWALYENVGDGPLE